MLSSSCVLHMLPIVIVMKSVWSVMFPHSCQYHKPCHVSFDSRPFDTSPIYPSPPYSLLDLASLPASFLHITAPVTVHTVPPLRCRPPAHQRKPQRFSHVRDDGRTQEQGRSLAMDHIIWQSLETSNQTWSSYRVQQLDRQSPTIFLLT